MSVAREKRNRDLVAQFLELGVEREDATGMRDWLRTVRVKHAVLD